MSTINFGIIGCGAIGQIHSYAISQIEGARLVAVADTNEEKCNDISAKYSCKAYLNYKEMLKRDDLDIVTVGLPPSLHCQAVLDAAEAGKHVIVEKPIDFSIENGEAMIEATKKAGVKFSVVFQHRFDRPIQLLKEAVSSGKMGKVHFGASRTIWYRTPEYYRVPGWRGTWAMDGGGVLMNQAIHYIDLIQYIMGPIQSISGKCDTLRHEIEVEDIGAAILRFKNGAMGTIEGTTFAYPGFNTELNIYGQDGAIGIKNDALDFYKFATGEDQEFEKLLKEGDHVHMYMGYNITGHKRQFENVMVAVKNNQDPLVTGEEGLKSIKIIKAIYESSSKNEWIEF